MKFQFRLGSRTTRMDQSNNIGYPHFSPPEAAPRGSHDTTVHSGTHALFDATHIDGIPFRHSRVYLCSLPCQLKHLSCRAQGAYLHADMDETVIMIFEDEMVDYMVQTNLTKYKSAVHVTKTGKKILYVQLLKALYGCIQSAMLWWKLLTSTLIEEGFVVNPYDPCVANKIMPDGSQCTVCWYVDDLKISHVDKAVVENIVTQIEKPYGKMTVTRGNKHTYIGMDIEFPGNGEVKILMMDYIREAIEAFPEDCTRRAVTPATNSLFKINPDATKLPEEKRELLQFDSKIVIRIEESQARYPSADIVSHWQSDKGRRRRLEEAQAPSKVFERHPGPATHVVHRQPVRGKDMCRRSIRYT
eukprot:scaffold2712_cov143-Cylindrotheca_fusiformis.AAC.5